MSGFILGPLVCMAGGDPGRVLALARALKREADGQRSWQHAQEGGGWLGPDEGRWLTYGALVLISIVVAILLKTVAAERIWLASTVLCLAQTGAIALTMARDAVPLLLSGADRRVIGWWPVSERELLLARSLLLLRGMSQTTIAIAAFPWMVLTGHAPVPLLSGPGALVGLGLHTVVLLVLLVLCIRGLARLVGLHWARRSVEMLGLLALIALTSQIGTDVPDGSFSGLRDFSSNWRMLALPTSWFAAWAALWPVNGPVLGAAILGAAASSSAVFFGLRMLGKSHRGEQEPVLDNLRPKLDWARPAVSAMGPFFKDREGRILLLLLCAHLRRDWRLTSQLVFLPLLYLVMIWRQVSQLTAAEPADALQAAGSIQTVFLFAGLLGLLLGSTVTFSSESTAAWILRGGVVDGRRMLVLHRRLLRFLVAVPFTATVMVMLQVRAGLPLTMLVPAAVAALLTCELAVVLAQWIRPALPFSRAWRRNEYGGSGQTILLITGLVPVLWLWGRLVLEKTIWGWPVTVVVQFLVLFVVLRILDRRIARLGLGGTGGSHDPDKA
jgi:hypothetical protein